MSFSFKEWIFFFLILTLGLTVRIYLATTSYNFDIENFIKTVKIFQNGGNIYALHKFYNYSPVYFYILGFIGQIQHTLFPYLPLYFFIRAFISLIDVVIMIVLVGIARINKISTIRTAAVFFLNPVSIIISGKHGQFDNLAILLILLAIYLLLVGQRKKRPPGFSVWILLTLALLIKHIIVFQFGLLMSRLAKRNLILTFFLSLSFILFFLTFVPYWNDNSKENIIVNVFKYGGIAGSYGVTSILRIICGPCIIHTLSLIYIYKYTFMLLSLFFTGLLVNLKKDIIWSVLVSFLFFLTFASGIGGQYFILPIAISALRPTKMYVIYSLIVTLFLLGNKYVFDIDLFKFASWNSVWLISIIWLINEMRPTIKTLYLRRGKSSLKE